MRRGCLEARGAAARLGREGWGSPAELSLQLGFAACRSVRLDGNGRDLSVL